MLEFVFSVLLIYMYASIDSSFIDTNPDWWNYDLDQENWQVFVVMETICAKHLPGVGVRKLPVNMTIEMMSYLINFILADRFSELSLYTKPI